MAELFQKLLYQSLELTAQGFYWRNICLWDSQWYKHFTHLQATHKESLPVDWIRSNDELVWFHHLGPSSRESRQQPRVTDRWLKKQKLFLPSSHKHLLRIALKRTPNKISILRMIPHLLIFMSYNINKQNSGILKSIIIDCNE